VGFPRLRIHRLLSAWRAFNRQQELADMKSNFVSSVSHELRAPIASVRLMAESLERGKIADAPKQQEYFRFIGRNVAASLRSSKMSSTSSHRTGSHQFDDRRAWRSQPTVRTHTVRILEEVEDIFDERRERRHSWPMKRKYSCLLGASAILPRSRLSAMSRTEASARAVRANAGNEILFISASSCWRLNARQAEEAR